MALVSKTTNPIIEGGRYLSGSRTGTRAAANFTVELGFTPTHIRVTNLTDRVMAEQTIDANLDAGNNVKGKLTAAAGTVTYEDCGIVLGTNERSFEVTVATVGLETADDDVIWSAWA